MVVRVYSFVVMEEEGEEGERKEVEEVDSTMSPCDMSTHDHFK